MLCNELKNKSGTLVKFDSEDEQSGQVKYAPPSRYLLWLHAALAHVSHAVANGEDGESFYDDDYIEDENSLGQLHENNLMILDQLLGGLQNQSVSWGPGERIFSQGTAMTVV